MSYPPSSLNRVSEREVLVRARGLTKRFGDFTAVDGIDFDLYRGEAFGFLGPNGAGKSSTMRMIGCVSPPTSGELVILGRDPEVHELAADKLKDFPAERAEVLADRILLYVTDGDAALAAVRSSGLEPLTSLVRRGTLEDRHGTASLGGVSYLAFVAPAILASSVMNTAMGEASYPVFGSIKWNRIYIGAQASPLRPGDIFRGHLMFMTMRIAMNA